MRWLLSPGRLFLLLLPLWLVVAVDMLWLRNIETYLFAWMATLIHTSVFSATAAVAILYVMTQRRKAPLVRNAAATAAYLPVWQWVMYVCWKLNIQMFTDFFLQGGIGVLFCIGLAWLVWYLELCAEDFRQRELAAGRAGQPTDKPKKRIWNPLNLKAWYYFQARRLNQSGAAFSVYSGLFALMLYVFSQMQGCDRYDLPGGGGGGGAPKASASAQKMQVEIKKVVRKKYLINPYSLIKFNPPPIDEVKLQLAQATEHLYKVGYGSGGSGFGEGDGTGSGFGGPGWGKVRFIRLEYAGGDWEQDFGVGADLNMLIQFGVLTQGMKVAEQTESMPITRLRGFPVTASPPMMYLTGQRSISLSVSEIAILRNYLLERHGMIFGDNGGSNHFHNQFFQAMRQVMPEVEPVRIPLDDQIHRVPFPLLFLPYVAPHGGRDAWGWKVDGRWVVYYHPGDIGDAWADGHSNVPREVYEACYQLGANVIYYAHSEQKKWRDAQKVK